MHAAASCGKSLNAVRRRVSLAYCHRPALVRPRYISLNGSTRWTALLPSPAHRPTPAHQTPSMPYVDIARGDDYVSLWYVTNSPTGHVGGFDPARPTVIMLHPFFLDSSWCDAQFGDPRLSAHYNLIAFDARAAGKTVSRPSGLQDAWTDAADLAFACHVSVSVVVCAAWADLCAGAVVIPGACVGERDHRRKHGYPLRSAVRPRAHSLRAFAF